MQYYFLRESINEKIMGKLPQIDDYIYHCDVSNEPKFIGNLNFKKIDFTPIPVYPILYPKSKKTDLIQRGGSISSHLLVSSKFKNILESFKVNHIQFFKNPIVHKGVEDHNYWVINSYNVRMDLIDFDNSKVFLMKNTFNKVEELNIRDIDSYKSKKLQILDKGYPYSILVENFKLKECTKEHFFVLKDIEGGLGYIVSEKLKKEIEDAGCTGIEFQPTVLSYDEWMNPRGEREAIYGKS